MSFRWVLSELIFSREDAKVAMWCNRITNSFIVGIGICQIYGFLDCLMKNFARRRNGRKFDVIVQRNLICWNWDLPDFGIFGLLDGKFRAKTQWTQIWCNRTTKSYLLELGFARFWDFWIAWWKISRKDAMDANLM